MFLGLPAPHVIMLSWSSTGLWHFPLSSFCFILLFLTICFTDFIHLLFVLVFYLLPLSLVPALYSIIKYSVSCSACGIFTMQEPWAMTSPLLLFCFRLSFINLILSFLPLCCCQCSHCVSISHRLEFLLSRSISVQLHYHTPLHLTTCNNPTGWHSTTEIFHRPRFSLYNLHTGATVFLLDFWTLRTGPRGCPETSVRNYLHSLHNNPEERSVQTLLKLACIFPVRLVI